MPQNPNKLSQFWQELKRRRVIHVIIVYATAAFVIIELVNNVTEPLKLPEWTPTLVIIILLVGFPLAIIFSWIFDVTPEGLEKTKPSRELEKAEKQVTSNSWKIATYVSVVIIAGLILLNIFGSGNGAKIDESLEKSVAVLPFLNLSGDPGQAFMCDGLTAEIIGHLYKIESLHKVVPLTSMLTYSGADKTISQIAEELQVNYILEGSHKKIGNQLRITANLIEPKNGKSIWQDDYDRPYEEIITIPADIALEIANYLKAFLTDSETRNISHIPTDNLKAYEVLQQVNQIINVRGMGATSELLDLVTEAIRLDPNYAEAYAGAGIFTLWKGIYTGDTDMQYAAMDALPFFEKALELDENNGLAHMGLAYVNDWARWNYIEAEKEYVKSIELAPNDPNLYGGIVEFYFKMHRLEDAISYIGKSQISDGFTFKNIKIHILSDRKPEARNLLTQESNDIRKLPFVGESYLWLEEYDSAKHYLVSSLQFRHPETVTPRFKAWLALANEKTDQAQQARTLIDQLIAMSKTTSVGSPSFFTGWYYSWIGEKDSAFYWLEKAYTSRSPEMPWLKTDPAFNNLKNDDRYRDLYERTGHKAYDMYIEGGKKK